MREELRLPIHEGEANVIKLLNILTMVIKDYCRNRLCTLELELRADQQGQVQINPIGIKLQFNFNSFSTFRTPCMTRKLNNLQVFGSK
jgi:hypothetical protein